MASFQDFLNTFSTGPGSPIDQVMPNSKGVPTPGMEAPGLNVAAPATAAAPAFNPFPDLDAAGYGGSKLAAGLGAAGGAYGQAMTASPIPQGPDATQLMTHSSTAKSGADAAAAPAGVAPTVASKLSAAGGGPVHTGMTGENHKGHTVEEMVAANRHLTPLDLQILQGYQKSPQDKITQQLVGASEGMRDQAIQQALARGDPAEIQKVREEQAGRHMEFLKQLHYTNPLALAQAGLFSQFNNQNGVVPPTGGIK